MHHDSRSPVSIRILGALHQQIDSSSPLLLVIEAKEHGVRPVIGIGNMRKRIMHARYAYFSSLNHRLNRSKHLLGHVIIQLYTLEAERTNLLYHLASYRMLFDIPAGRKRIFSF
ncbi:hypothetical protein D3C80_1866940 [compost metagenome]